MPRRPCRLRCRRSLMLNLLKRAQSMRTHSKQYVLAAADARSHPVSCQQFRQRTESSQNSVLTVLSRLVWQPSDLLWALAYCVYLINLQVTLDRPRATIPLHNHLVYTPRLSCLLYPYSGPPTCTKRPCAAVVTAGAAETSQMPTVSEGLRTC